MEVEAVSIAKIYKTHWPNHNYSIFSWITPQTQRYPPPWLDTSFHLSDTWQFTTLNLDFWDLNLDFILWGVISFPGQIPWITCYFTNGTLCTLTHWSQERERARERERINIIQSFLNTFSINMIIIYRHLFILVMIQPLRYWKPSYNLTIGNHKYILISKIENHNLCLHLNY